jgi:CTP synthase (UTP-ammonia lyase)
VRKAERTAHIGIVGDFDPGKPSHAATNAAIDHAAESLKIKTKVSWMSTPSLLHEAGLRSLKDCDGIWASPGSPYQSMEGALKGIELARQMDRPFIST